MFYNVIDSIKAKNFKNLAMDSFKIFITDCMFSITHFLAYVANIDALKTVLKLPDFVLTCDNFGKSPFYYAILRKNQNVIDLLLEHLALLKLTEDTQYNLSYYSLRNDFYIILKNSSSKLPNFLRRMLFSSSICSIKMQKSLPDIRPSNFPHPIVKNFLHSIDMSEKAFIKEKNVIFRKSPFPILGSNWVSCEYQTSRNDYTLFE